MTRRTVTFVKKILADGQPCRKCADVEARLTASDYWGEIDHVVVADERDPASEGMQLATRLNVERAPFFVVENQGNTTVYTVYLKFVRDVLGQSSETSEAQLLLHANPDLDLL
jgi:hypothetical protein